MRVRIRTYRQGLGDCFLLTFFGDDRECHVLIDCGVLVGTENATAVIKKVVANITEVTGGKLDVLVATHEHWDHVSGFNQARDEFDALNIGSIWMAWTEDPDDEQATRLREEREHKKVALAAAFSLWKDGVDANPLQAAGGRGRLGITEQLLGFFGELGVHQGRRKTSDAMEYLRQRDVFKRYLEPGMVQALPDLPGVRAFVLGPPRDLQRLKKERPSKTAPETYTGGEAALSMEACFFAAVEHRSAPSSASERAFPFDAFYRKSASELAADPFYSDRYLHAEPWRRIDYDWLAATADLALALDSDTNNTSLVLAFELGEGGDVLLFPADAQVGNWLSWHDVEWRGCRGVHADDLLARTVFYKVAHHGSHNATLRERGLEKMTHEKLMAMVPVDAATAEKQGWAMPFEPLWERLAEKCRGRILRSDSDGPDGRRLRRLPPEERETFKQMVGGDAQNQLYIDVEIEA